MKHKLSCCNGNVLERTSVHPHTLSPGAHAPIKEWTIKKNFKFYKSSTNTLQHELSALQPHPLWIRKKKVEFQKSLSLECPKVHHRDPVA